MPRGGLADPNFRKTPTGQVTLAVKEGRIPPVNSGSLTGGGYVPGAGGSAGAVASEGVRKLTPEDIANMQANAAAQLAGGLTGPFTPEARASGYASIVAQLYGVNYPKAQAWASLAARRKWDQSTFSRYLRSRPEFGSTDIGKRMRADVLAVIAQTFGRIG